jgi:Cytochrome P460
MANVLSNLFSSTIHTSSEVRSACRRVYGNPTAIKSMSPSVEQGFRVGTIIAKEKLAESPHASPDGVAFMVKRPQSDFPDTGGWQFLYFPASGDDRNAQHACASCHRAASSKDYVFGRYPR